MTRNGKNYGGKQAERAAKRATLPATMHNLALMFPTENEAEVLERLRAFMKELGVTLEEYAPPVHTTGKRCPECKELLHHLAPECQHCGAKELK